MLMMRLQRVGRKNEPHFRVVLTEKTTPPRGKYIELLGFVNPKSKDGSIKKERIDYWLSQGAGVSDTVHNLLISKGILRGKKISKHNIPEKKQEEVDKK